MVATENIIVEIPLQEIQNETTKKYRLKENRQCKYSYFMWSFVFCCYLVYIGLLICSLIIFIYMCLSGYTFVIQNNINSLYVKNTPFIVKYLLNLNPNIDIFYSFSEPTLIYENFNVSFYMSENTKFKQLQLFFNKNSTLQISSDNCNITSSWTFLENRIFYIPIEKNDSCSTFVYLNGIRSLYTLETPISDQNKIYTNNDKIYIVVKGPTKQLCDIECLQKIYNVEFSENTYFIFGFAILILIISIITFPLASCGMASWFIDIFYS
jgi:hypothetical protein